MPECEHSPPRRANLEQNPSNRKRNEAGPHDTAAEHTPDPIRGPQ
jgi:hypothetical protein